MNTAFESLGLTQEQFAKAFGVTTSTHRNRNTAEGSPRVLPAPCSTSSRRSPRQCSGLYSPAGVLSRQEMAPAGGLEPPTPGLTGLVAVLRDELGLAPTQIAELLDIVADMLEQGEAATGSGHSENPAIGRAG